jgi:hypothetical protein
MFKIGQNNDYNLTQPMVWLNCNAKNSYKYPNLIFRHLVNPLWGIIPPATVFPEDQTLLSSCPSRLIPATQYSDDSKSVIFSTKPIDLAYGQPYLNFPISHQYLKTFMQI